MPTRRHALKSLAAAALLPLSGVRVAANDSAGRLHAAPSRHQFAPEGFPSTELWTYDGTFPGPLLRAPQGGRLSLDLENGLNQPTSVHWHGIRIDNAMDGVPGLTQDPVAPGGRFRYDFALPDAGTYWYHSHAQSVEQVERGLHGALIVDEADSVEGLDDDIVLVIDDIRLTRDGEVSADFDNRHDRSHAGRIGNLWLANGRIDPAQPVRRGQRLRLRLINAANARIFTLGLRGLEGWQVALDGMPLAAPMPLPLAHRIMLAPAQRVDLIVDVTEREDEALLVTFERDGGYVLASFPVSGGDARRPEAPPPLPANPQVPINPGGARRISLVMEGGAMGGLTGARVGGQRKEARELARDGLFWAFNGEVGLHNAFYGDRGAPLAEIDRGESLRIGLVNETAFAHAMHLHGMHFSEVRPDGRLGPLRDTLLIGPRETREIAFVAHNPGDWLFHCHMLSHHAAGMGTWLRVRG